MTNNDPVHKFLAGRYNKYLRDLSQTPWIDKNDVRVKNSVQELIEEGVFEYIKCQKVSFSTSGREDVDVRMLGTGRPFVFKIVNPDIKCDNVDDAHILTQIEKYINSKFDGVVKVRYLQFVSKEEVSKNLTIDEDKNITKKYGALCCCSRALTAVDLDKINGTKDLVLDQKTPIRVLHRRALATRNRTIHSMSVEAFDPKQMTCNEFIEHTDRVFFLNLETESGTYIKEFVHGDFGRTEPNLASLLGDCETDIMELDVLEVNLDWPSEISKQIDQTATVF